MLPGGITVTASPASLEPGGKSTITVTAPSLPATGPRSNPGASCGPPVACVSLSSSSSTAAQGVPVTLQATIQTIPRAPATVTFYNGTTQLGAPVAVSQNIATLQITNLPAGLNQLTAIWPRPNIAVTRGNLLASALGLLCSPDEHLLEIGIGSGVLTQKS
jgi:hypothetical protein